MFNWNLDENFIWFLKNKLLIIFRFQNQQLWRNSPSQLNLSKTILPMQAVWSHWKVLTTGIDLWKMSWCFKSLIESVDHLKGILNLVKLKILLFDAWHMQKSELFIESPFLPYCHRFRDGLKKRLESWSRSRIIQNHSVQWCATIQGRSPLTRLMGCSTSGGQRRGATRKERREQ